MAREIDARGLSCPQPVIMARDAVQDGDFPVAVLLDGGTSVENVRRAMQKIGCTVQVENMAGGFRMVINR